MEVTPVVARRKAPSNLLWLARRIGLGAATLILVSIVIFGVTQALPGDPARAILGQTATPEQIESLEQKLGLDRPLIEQYSNWFVGVLTGDLGRSVVAQGEKPVREIIATPLRNSSILVLITVGFTLPLSYILGSVAALKRDRFSDHLFNIGSLIIVALPQFVLGMLLILAFSTAVFNWFPAVALFPPADSPIRHLNVLVLPTLTLVLVNVPYIARLVRASMIDVLESEYIRYARLKGVGNRSLIMRHAIPNAVVPAIQATALTVAWLVGGIVVIEYLFRYPGLGSTLTDAIGNRDIAVIQAVVVIFATWYVFFNLVADLLSVFLTPALRTREHD